MLSRRLLSARPLSRVAARTTSLTRPQVRHLSEEDIVDPNMNGAYPQPPPTKRQFRDPHAQWWDKQERRNFGEPVHEDNDILGMFSLHEYTHTTPGKAMFQIGLFIATVCGVAGAASYLYEDKPSYPREFPGGLKEELGGEETRARMEGDEYKEHQRMGG